MFDINLLRTFLAVIDAGQFTAGGAAIGMSQSTVSQHIRRLEEACGRQLLVRDTHAVTLTQDGAAMAGFAREIVGTSLQAEGYFAGSAPRGRVRLGVSDDLALTRLPTILRDLLRINPLISIELTVGLTSTLYQKLDSGRLDLLFCKRQTGDDRGHVVQRERLVWLAHADFRLAPEASVPIVLYPSSSITSRHALEALNRAGRPWFIACSSETLAGLRAGVQAGLGVMAQSRLLLQGGGLALAPESANLPQLGEVEFVILGRSHKLHGASATLAALIEEHGAGLWMEPQDSDMAPGGARSLQNQR
ncbi:MAG TPA: LysR substrate-binding domain-containing protein [Caulobacteraceae bacterium]|jgi:DNA-binding transcriptional LysR family regulator|nr:LysR substrate-binding domain-containing protein [Caulobacteraceae bacterium]